MRTLTASTNTAVNATENMLMYYKYDEFSMYKAMGFAAKNEENDKLFARVAYT